MTAGDQPLQIVRTIIELARVLGMDVVAEGIETREQFRLLRQLGCRFGQGYLSGGPWTLMPSLRCFICRAGFCHTRNLRAPRRIYKTCVYDPGVNDVLIQERFCGVPIQEHVC